MRLRRRTITVGLRPTLQHLQDAGVSVAGRVTFCATHDRAFLDDDADVCQASEWYQFGGTHYDRKWEACVRGLRYALVMIDGDV